MDRTLDAAARAPLERLSRPGRDWWPVCAGLALLYLPTLYDLLTGLWLTEEQGHGPIILAMALWLMARQWPRAGQAGAGGRAPGAADAGAQAAGGHAQPAGQGAPPPDAQPARAGWAVLAVGLLLYILGRSQHIIALEIGSFLWVMAALVLLKFGTRALRALWFPFFFMLFMIPLPGQLVSMLTLPMKTAVSYITEHLLYLAGYPIARNGVILQIGQYQLLVADACAGLQTLLTLEALGLFYLNVVRHTSSLRNIALALLIIPISFTANVIRVIVLTLVTYYFGDAAGQGFLHGFAGMVLFVSALILILALDSLLQFGISRRRAAKVAR
ncbi:MAG: exosortase B [Pseudomonadota bacterium]